MNRRTACTLSGATRAVIGLTACTSTKTVPGPTETVVEYSPDPTITVTVTPTANAQGQATTISASGVYVVGQDIAAGTWHASGSPTGSDCYFATLNSTNTNDIIDNNNFTGPETVSTSGADALEINGDCTWNLEG